MMTVSPVMKDEASPPILATPTAKPKPIPPYACIDGPEIDAHIIDWDKFLPRFNAFKAQEEKSRVVHGLV